MGISYQSAAQTMCEESGWEISNLELHKLLYLAQMRYLGKNDEPLIRDDLFQAWKYGPVLPVLYHKTKKFGSKSIRAGFFNVSRNLSRPEHRNIINVYGKFGDLTPGQLVEITHKQGGAWDISYDSLLDNVVIPNEDIKNEYLRAPF